MVVIAWYIHYYSLFSMFKPGEGPLKLYLKWAPLKGRSTRPHQRSSIYTGRYKVLSREHLTAEKFKQCLLIVEITREMSRGGELPFRQQRLFCIGLTSVHKHIPHLLFPIQWPRACITIVMSISLSQLWCLLFFSFAVQCIFGGSFSMLCISQIYLWSSHYN